MRQPVSAALSISTIPFATGETRRSRTPASTQMTKAVDDHRDDVRRVEAVIEEQAGRDRAGDRAALEGGRVDRVVAAPVVVGGQVVAHRRDGRLHKRLPEREDAHEGEHRDGPAGQQAGRAEDEPRTRPHQRHRDHHPGTPLAADPGEHQGLQQHDHRGVDRERDADGAGGDVGHGAYAGKPASNWP